MAELEERNYVEEDPKKTDEQAEGEGKEGEEKMDVETPQNIEERLN